MKDGILVGMALGFLIGAIVVTNNEKAKEIVNKGKKIAKEQVKKITE